VDFGCKSFSSNRETGQAMLRSKDALQGCWSCGTKPTYHDMRGIAGFLECKQCSFIASGFSIDDATRHWNRLHGRSHVEPAVTSESF